MARTSGTLLGLGAGGSLGGKLTYASWKGRTYCKKQGLINNSNSPAQRSARIYFAFLSRAAWSSLTPAQQALWNELAKTTSVTEKNAFIKEGMDTFPTPFAPHQEPGQTPGGTQVVFQGFGKPFVTGGKGKATVSYQIKTINDNWGLFCLVNAGGGAQTFLASMIVLPSIVGAGFYSIDGLEKGTYAFDFQSFTTTGLPIDVVQRAGIIIT